MLRDPPLPPYQSPPHAEGIRGLTFTLVAMVALIVLIVVGAVLTGLTIDQSPEARMFVRLIAIAVLYAVAIAAVIVLSSLGMRSRKDAP